MQYLLHTCAVPQEAASVPILPHCERVSLASVYRGGNRLKRQSSLLKVIMAKWQVSPDVCLPPTYKLLHCPRVAQQVINKYK